MSNILCYFGIHHWGKWKYIGCGLQIKTCQYCNKKKSASV